MTFRLEKQSPGKISTRFHVVDSANAICGIVSVPNEDVSDFQNHWKNAPASSSPKKAANAKKQVSAIAAAIHSNPRTLRDQVAQGTTNSLVSRFERLFCDRVITATAAKKRRKTGRRASRPR